MVAKENKEVVSKKTYSCNTQRWKEKNEKGIMGHELTLILAILLILTIQIRSIKYILPVS